MYRRLKEQAAAVIAGLRSRLSWLGRFDARIVIAAAATSALITCAFLALLFGKPLPEGVGDIVGALIGTALAISGSEWLRRGEARRARREIVETILEHVRPTKAILNGLEKEFAKAAGDGEVRARWNRAIEVLDQAVEATRERAQATRILADLPRTIAPDLCPLLAIHHQALENLHSEMSTRSRSWRHPLLLKQEGGADIAEALLKKLPHLISDLDSAYFFLHTRCQWHLNDVGHG